MFPMPPPWLFATWFLSLEEIAFLFAGFIVLLTCGSGGLTLRHLCNGNVPPGLVVWDALRVLRLNDDHRSTGLFSRGAEGGFEVFPATSPSRPGSETRGVGREIHGQEIAVIFPVLATPILCSHAFITAAPAEPPNA